jgi:hypothetical protein
MGKKNKIKVTRQCNYAYIVKKIIKIPNTEIEELCSPEKLCMLARSHAITADKLLNNEHEIAKQNATIATNLYFKLISDEHEFYPYEIVFMELAFNIVDPKIWEEFIKINT